MGNLMSEIVENLDHIEASIDEAKDGMERAIKAIKQKNAKRAMTLLQEALLALDFDFEDEDVELEFDDDDE